MTGSPSRLRGPLWFRLTTRHLLAHRLQTFLMVAGVALGVAVVISIDIANQSAERAFTMSTQAVTGRATHEITGGSDGVPVSAYAELRRQGIRSIAPVIERLVIPTSGRPLTLLGMDPFAEAPFRPYLESLGPQSSILDDLLTVPGAALLAPDTAAELGVAVGEAFELDIDANRRRLVLVGTPTPARESHRRALTGLVLTDISTAQELTAQPTRFDRVDVLLPSGDETERQRIATLLAPGLSIAAVGAEAGPVREMIQAFQTNLYALSLLALIVGMFLIFNTMTFAVVQRTELIGTLRALGVTRSEIFRGVCAEAAVVGLVGTTIGVVLGISLGRGSVDMVTQTVNDLFYALTVRSVAIPPMSIVKGVVLGLIATVATAAFPAREAAAAQPRTALSRSAMEETAGDLVTRSAAVGGALLLVGTALLLIPSRDLWLAFGGLFAVIVGLAFFAPVATRWLMGACAKPMGRLWGALGAAAPRDVTRSLSRTSTAIAALMLAVSVAIGLRIMIGSFRTTVAVWLDTTLRGDVYLSGKTLGGTAATTPLEEGVLAYLRDLDGVDRVDLVRSTSIDTARGPVQASASSRPYFDDLRLYKELAVDAADVPARLAKGDILVSEPLATRLGLSAGVDRLSLSTVRGERAARIVGVYYDYASTQGQVLLDRSLYSVEFDDDAVTGAALILDDAARSAAVSDRVARELAPIQTLRVRPNRELRREVFEVFDQAFAITRALVILATGVATLGVLSALLALQLERRRDYGMLRALGVTGRQAARHVFMQTGLLGGSATLLAIPTGVLLAVLLIYVINRRAFGWTLHMQLAADPFVAAFALAAIAAAAAALLPAWRMWNSRAAELLR